MKRTLAVLALASFGLMAAPPTGKPPKTEEPAQQLPAKKVKKVKKNSEEHKTETPAVPSKK
jgi:hypothetical protein